MHQVFIYGKRFEIPRLVVPMKTQDGDTLIIRYTRFPKLSKFRTFETYVIARCERDLRTCR